jgi:hypothetical protein
LIVEEVITGIHSVNIVVIIPIVVTVQDCEWLTTTATIIV